MLILPGPQSYCINTLIQEVDVVLAESVIKMSTAGAVAQLILYLVIPAAFVVYAFRGPTDRQVVRWAESRGVALSDGSRALVHRYLRRTRRLRTLGAALGFTLVTLPGAIYNFLPDKSSELGRLLVGVATGNWGFAATAIGYLAGALVAEFSLARETRGPARATLVPREVSQYTARWGRVGLWVLVGALAAATALPAVVPLEQEIRPYPTVLTFTLMAALGLGVAVCTEGMFRAIVRRPQRFTDPALLEADDAVRASSVHACLGASLAMLMVLLGHMLNDISLNTTSPALRSWSFFMGIVLVLATITTWSHYGMNHTWIVRRRSTPCAAATSQPQSS